MAYNSGGTLRGCVESLLASSRIDVRVIVVDNASSDGGISTIADLPVHSIRSNINGGFGYGCNLGWRAGEAPFVLFANPDARVDEDMIYRLAARLENDTRMGAVGPRIYDAGGGLDFSLRRFPRLRSTFAQALFLHRIFRGAEWAGEVISDPAAYCTTWDPEWVSGACLLVRREALESVAGFDEAFFLYCEDKDLCKRLWDVGYRVTFEPSARCHHVGGVSGDRSLLLPVLAASRVRYARKHMSRMSATAERVGVALSSLTHIVISRAEGRRRRGHLRALLVALLPRLAGPPNRSVSAPYECHH